MLFLATIGALSKLVGANFVWFRGNYATFYPAYAAVLYAAVWPWVALVFAPLVADGVHVTLYDGGGAGHAGVVRFHGLFADDEHQSRRDFALFGGKCGLVAAVRGWACLSDYPACSSAFWHDSGKKLNFISKFPANFVEFLRLYRW